MTFLTPLRASVTFTETFTDWFGNTSPSAVRDGVSIVGGVESIPTGMDLVMLRLNPSSSVTVRFAW